MRKLPNLVLSSGADFPNSPVRLPSFVAMDPTSDVRVSIDELVVVVVVVVVEVVGAVKAVMMKGSGGTERKRKKVKNV